MVYSYSQGFGWWCYSLPNFYSVETLDFSCHTVSIIPCQTKRKKTTITPKVNRVFWQPQVVSKKQNAAGKKAYKNKWASSQITMLYGFPAWVWRNRSSVTTENDTSQWWLRSGFVTLMQGIHTAWWFVTKPLLSLSHYKTGSCQRQAVEKLLKTAAFLIFLYDIE